MVKNKSSVQLPKYKLLEDIQMRHCQQKIVKKIIRVWIAINPKRNNEINSLNFLLLDENVSFPFFQILHI